MSLLEYMRTEGQARKGKATAEDLIQVRQMIPNVDTYQVPMCIFEGDGDQRRINPENFITLLWIQVKSELEDDDPKKKKITREEIAAMINATDADIITTLIHKIYAFWSKASEDEFASRARIEVIEGEPESEPENPTPSESNLNTIPESS